jgi:putative FmdB family regulatory protein
MPFYRYECETCGHRFRVLHLEGAEDDATCPSCGGEETRRLLSRVSVQFKGSGYYKTDRAGKRSKAGTKSLADKNGEPSASPKEATESTGNASSDDEG